MILILKVCRHESCSVHSQTKSEKLLTDFILLAKYHSYQTMNIQILNVVTGYGIVDNIIMMLHFADYDNKNLQHKTFYGLDLC